MNIEDFLSNICCHSQDIGCLEKARIGRHIIESMIHSNIELTTLLDLDPSIKKNVIFDVLHFKQHAHLGETLFNDWDTAKQELEKDLKDKLIENDYLIIANKTKKYYDLYNSDQYSMLLENLLTSEFTKEGTSINNEEISGKIIELLKQYTNDVFKDWVTEGYYLICEN